jgi:uncharacterized protein (TIRG00374 family)
LSRTAAISQQTLIKPIGSAFILIIGASFLLFSKDLNLRDAYHSFDRVDPLMVLLAFGAVIGQVTLQACRFWILFPKTLRPSFGELLRIFSFGQWMNIFIPARAGDVMKVLALKSDASEKKVAVADATGVLIADKALDIGALLLLLLMTHPTWLYQEAPHLLPSGWVLAAIVTCLVTAWIAIRYFFSEKLSKLGTLFRQLTQATSALKNPTILVRSFLIALTPWFAEMMALSVLCRAFQFQVSLSGLAQVLAILNLGVAIPISFANLGAFEAAMAFGLSRMGIPAAEGLAIASLHHLLQVLGVTFWAFVCWLSHFTYYSFRVSEDDKNKALEHYEQKARGGYNQIVERGMLKGLRDRERNMVLDFADLKNAGKTMIDVGCGGGFYALEAKRQGMHVCAVDAVPAMLENLLHQVDQVQLSDIESMDTQKKYDLVVCAGVLDFVRNPSKSFENLCSLVAPDGKLVILVPKTGLGGLAYRFEKKCSGINVNLYTRRWLAQQAENNGLELVKTGYPLPYNLVGMFKVKK